ncbi:hypothetical protein LCGC14_1710250 [marine sediment metagenome]|uniref:Uncharacterized protein n=1 Tax=marine sediment metagenome TaxID=412755 RepID=A0A0F9HG31_9ZZZZ
MLDLNEQPSLPNYELKLKDGTVKSYDSLILSYAMRALDGEANPTKIQETINQVFDIDVDAFAAMVIMNDFVIFAEAELEEPLKKVFGRELSSTITTASRPENIKS